MKWLISIPVWGKYHTDTFIRYALPALRLVKCNLDVQLIVHTDDASKLWKEMAGLPVQFRPLLEGPTPHDTFGNCHREAIELAETGQFVLLLCADMVASKEVLAASEARFAEGKKLIIAAATRCAMKKVNKPPLGATARELLDWTLTSVHPSVQDCFWGTGGSMLPWALYFKSETSVVVRGFHLHPISMVKSPGLTFTGISIDEFLVDKFTEEEIHVVTSPDELALAELSPPERMFKCLPHPMTPKSVYIWANHRTTPRHRWLFTHRIVIQGVGEELSDVAPCEAILEKLRWSRDSFNGELPHHFTEGVDVDIPSDHALTEV